MRGRETAKDIIGELYDQRYGTSVSRSPITHEHKQLYVRGLDSLKVQGEVQNVDVRDLAGSLRKRNEWNVSLLRLPSKWLHGRSEEQSTALFSMHVGSLACLIPPAVSPHRRDGRHREHRDGQGCDQGHLHVVQRVLEAAVP
jgi:hypothetical protein